MNQNLTSLLSRSQVPRNLKPIKGFVIFLSVSGFLVTSAVSAIAQELPGCFLRNRSGDYVRLNNICVFPDDEFDPISRGTGTPGVYEIPIVRRQGGIPVIEVVFNESQTFEMMVDTGASGTAITPVMAELLGVVATARGRADTPSQRNVEFDIGLVQSIGVGGARQSNLPVAIAPALSIGLLGQDFFGRYDVTIREDMIEFRERA